MGAFLKNWKTTVIPAVLMLGPYALQFAGLWPAALPLPPFEQVYPQVMGLLGLGAVAKDFNVTGK
jgi:hypothetical protein